VPRISIAHVTTAIQKVQAMSLPQRLALADEIFLKQPNLLASCLVQPRLGVAAASVEFLLNILFVCYQAMTESGLKWPVISEADQERQMNRLGGSVRFAEDLRHPDLGNAALADYVRTHPEQPLLAFVARETGDWLKDLARRNVEAESDKYVLMASINFVNCIAQVEPQISRG
jgi:hypothetical protein